MKQKNASLPHIVSHRVPPCHLDARSYIKYSFFIPSPAFTTSWRAALQNLFGIDVRALAAFRMALALLVLLDLIGRGRSLFAFYDDLGTFPRSFLITNYASPWNVSLHMLSGAWPIQLVLFLMAAVFAVMLLVGYKTRLATIITWALLLSVHNRNPFIIQACDTLLRMGLFWAMFLPWQKKLSVDEALAPSPEPTPAIITSPATAALLGQVALVYLGGAIHKSSEVWLKAGNSLYMTLNLDGFTTAFGQWLLKWPTLLTMSSRGTYLLELFGPLLLFTPVWTPYIRLVMVGLYASFHLGIAATLKIGLFAWIDLAMLIVFLPPLFWDWLGRFIQRLSPPALHIYYDSNCGFCGKSVRLIHTFVLPYNLTATPAAANPAIAKLMAAKNSWVVVDHRQRHHFGYDGVCTVITASPFIRFLAPLVRQRGVARLGERLYRWVANHRRLTCTPDSIHPPWVSPEQAKMWDRVAQLIAASFFLLVLAWNIAAYPGVTWKFPPQFYALLSLSRVDQHWGMFAPTPPLEDGWYVMPGTLRDGTTIDIFSGASPVNWEKPARVSSLYADQFWRKYLMLLWAPQYAAARPYYAAYLCQNWNNEHPPDKHLTDLSIYYVLERTPATRNDAPMPLEYLEQIKHECAI